MVIMPERRDVGERDSGVMEERSGVVKGPMSTGGSSVMAASGVLEWEIPEANGVGLT